MQRSLFYLKKKAFRWFKNSNMEYGKIYIYMHSHKHLFLIYSYRKTYKKIIKTYRYIMLPLFFYFLFVKNKDNLIQKNKPLGNCYKTSW